MNKAAGRAGGGRGWNELALRTASALVMAAVALAVTWVGGATFGHFWLVAGILVLFEWVDLVGLRRRRLALVVGPFAMLAAVEGLELGNLIVTGVALAVGAALTFVIASPGERVLAVSGLIYAAVLVVAVPLLRQSEPFGFAAILWLFAVVWGTDTMAFFGGRLIGGPKLAPRLSPSKTWSGFLVGIISGALLGLVVVPRPVAVLPVLLVGLAGGALAQGGDLFESALKRRFGVKDAGSLIPGHGGVMDRLDGFVATSLFAAILGVWRCGPGAAGAGLFKW